MTRLSPRPWFAAAAALASPAWLVLLALSVGGWLAPWPALLGAVAVTAVALVLSWLQAGQVQALARYLRSQVDQPGAAAPPRASRFGTSVLGPELTRAAVEGVRAWTARQRRLEAVAAGNETILASLPDPLVLLDREGRVVRANRAAETLFEGRLLGRDYMTFLRHPAVIEAVDAVMGGDGGRLIEFALRLPVQRSLSARVEPLRDGAAGGAAVLISLHDLTAIKRADQMRADFVANASHELRTPLSTLVGFIETLRGPAHDDPEARDRFLAIMHEQATRMARLVEDLLSLSRIELNEHSPPAGRVDLAAVVQSVAEALRFKADQRNVRILLDAPPPLRTDGAPQSVPLHALPPVAGDADELAQVFQNLLDNAIKYGWPGSTVRVSSWLTRAGSPRRLSRPAVAVAVSDEGEGIPREHIPRLTQRFYRVDTTRSRDLGGTGLGLAIVKHVLTHHRGALEIESSLGEGSTFTVHLPLGDAATDVAGFADRDRAAVERRDGALTGRFLA